MLGIVICGTQWHTVICSLSCLLLRHCCYANSRLLQCHCTGKRAYHLYIQIMTRHNLTVVLKLKKNSCFMFTLTGVHLLKL